MRHTRVIPIMMALLLLAIAAPGVHAAATLLSPAASGEVSGTYTLNATITNTCPSASLCNITYYASSTSTANSSQSTVATLTNHNVTLDGANVTFDSTILEDATNYVFGVNFSNGTAAESDTSSSVLVDNTVPSTPTTPSPADASTSQATTINFSITVGAANTTACTLVFDGDTPNDGEATYTMTHSGAVCFRQFTSVSAKTYTWSVNATDGTNVSASSSFTLSTVNGVGGGGGGGGPKTILYDDGPDLPDQAQKGIEQAASSVGQGAEGKSTGAEERGVFTRIIDWFKSFFD